MVRVRNLLVVFAVGILLLATCSKPKNVLRLTCDEAGNYAIDVAHWISERTEAGDLEWTAVMTDAIANINAYYIQPVTGFNTYPPNLAVRLESYTVTWAATGVKIPRLSGYIDVLVPADVSGTNPKTFSLLLCPAINKDTVSALQNLRGDPESDRNTFVGQIIARATVEVVGKDQVTNEEVRGSLQLQTTFADYQDPNNLH